VAQVRANYSQEAARSPTSDQSVLFGRRTSTIQVRKQQGGKAITRSREWGITADDPGELNKLVEKKGKENSFTPTIISIISPSNMSLVEKRIVYYVRPTRNHRRGWKVRGGEGSGDGSWPDQ